MLPNQVNNTQMFLNWKLLPNQDKDRYNIAHLLKIFSMRRCYSTIKSTKMFKTRRCYPTDTRIHTSFEIASCYPTLTGIGITLQEYTSVLELEAVTQPRQKHVLRLEVVTQPRQG